LRKWLPSYPYLALPHADEGGGTDIEPLHKAGTFMSSVTNSQRYFDHHHSATDVFEAVNKRELELGAFAMAASVWLVSEHGF
jgi:hypothetical protein